MPEHQQHTIQPRDWILVLILALSLYTPQAAALFCILPLLRDSKQEQKWDMALTLLVASTLWGLVIMTQRGLPENATTALLYGLTWTLPLLLYGFNPTKGTVYAAKYLIYLLFALDFLFNIFGSATGSDLLGRDLDVREGTTGSRLGGLFGHSFYSGTISILALVFLLADKSYLAAFAVINLLLAGSFRLLVPLALLPFLLVSSKWRSRTTELLFVLVAIMATIAAITLSSSLMEHKWIEHNPANDLRLFAWLNSIDNILQSPWTGANYPAPHLVESVNIQSIQEYFIAESWILSTALTFGLPYTILRLGGLLLYFYGPRFQNRSPEESYLVPIILVDISYGEAFEGLLFYTVLWIILLSNESRRGQAI